MSKLERLLLLAGLDPENTVLSMVLAVCVEAQYWLGLRAGLGVMVPFMGRLGADAEKPLRVDDDHPELWLSSFSLFLSTGKTSSRLMLGSRLWTTIFGALLLAIGRSNLVVMVNGADERYVYLTIVVCVCKENENNKFFFFVWLGFVCRSRGIWVNE